MSKNGALMTNHKTRVIDNPYPDSSPGLFRAACTCNAAFLSRYTRHEAQLDAIRHGAGDTRIYPDHNQGR